MGVGGWMEIVILMKTQSSTLTLTLDSDLGFVNSPHCSLPLAELNQAVEAYMSSCLILFIFSKIKGTKFFLYRKRSDINNYWCLLHLTKVQFTVCVQILSLSAQNKATYSVKFVLYEYIPKQLLCFNPTPEKEQKCY